MGLKLFQFRQFVRLLALSCLLFSCTSCLLNPVIQCLLYPDKKEKNLLSLFALFQKSNREVSLNKSFLGLQKASSDRLIAVINESGNLSPSNFNWESSNPNIASVNNEGFVTAVSNGKSMISAVEVGTNLRASCIVTVYSGFLYVSLDGNQEVSRSTMNNNTGQMTFNSVISTIGFSPTGIAADPFGRFLYTGDFSSDLISQFNINSSNGTLSANGSIGAPTAPRNIAITPDGKFLYIAAETSQTIRHYLINSNGTLSFVNSYPVAVTTQVSIDPTGKYLITQAPAVNQFSSFAIDQNSGALTLAGRSPTISDMGLISIHPSGRYIYVGGSPTVTVLELNLNDGSLSIIGTAPKPDSPNGSTVHPSGRFVYFVNLSAGTISLFEIEDSSGQLTFKSNIVSGSSDLRFIVVEPSGRFAYLASRGIGNDLLQFSINQTTGELTSMGTVNVGGLQWNLFFL